MKLTKAQEERLEKFIGIDKCNEIKFTFNKYGINRKDGLTLNLFKHHLAEELSLQRSEIIQIAEGMKDYKYGHPKKAEYIDCDCGYSFDDCVCERNETLNELISTLTTLQEGK